MRSKLNVSRGNLVWRYLFRVTAVLKSGNKDLLDLVGCWKRDRWRRIVLVYWRGRIFRKSFHHDIDSLYYRFKMCRSKWSLRRHTAVPACLFSRSRLPSSRARGWNAAIYRHLRGMESSGEVYYLQRSIYESLNLDRLQMIRKTV